MDNQFDASSDDQASFLFVELDRLADKTAEVFVEEYGEAFDPAATDWDSEAFAEDWRTLKRSHGDGIEALRAKAVDRYIARLESETKRLVG